MKMIKNELLANYTSFGVGGPADSLIFVESSEELISALENTSSEPITLIGYGSNCLISDRGIRGTVICTRGGAIDIADTMITVDAGVWWDDVVQAAIDNELWGIELMGEIPGSVGASAFINITAYGQAFGSVVSWIDVWDMNARELRRIPADELEWGYKESYFQQNPQLIIVRVQLSLSRTPTSDVRYQKALDVAAELDLDMHTLTGRRAVIHEARNRAGSLWHFNDNAIHTVGSFFRNPIVDLETAEHIIGFDETGKTKTEIRKMNQVHGGDTKRISAAHVMLASGFSRGQQWGKVKLNNQNLLKIEALPGATAQEIYDVATHIQQTAQQKLGVRLEPEASILGDFNKSQPI